MNDNYRNEVEKYQAILVESAESGRTGDVKIVDGFVFLDRDEVRKSCDKKSRLLHLI